MHVVEINLHFVYPNLVKHELVVFFQLSMKHPFYIVTTNEIRMSLKSQNRTAMDARNLSSPSVFFYTVLSMMSAFWGLSKRCINQSPIF
jgi:hypothetical protein